jgi:hypothetical protein
MRDLMHTHQHRRSRYHHATIHHLPALSDILAVSSAVLLRGQEDFVDPNTTLQMQLFGLCDDNGMLILIKRQIAQCTVTARSTWVVQLRKSMIAPVCLRWRKASTLHTYWSLTRREASIMMWLRLKETRGSELRKHQADSNDVGFPQTTPPLHAGNQSWR